MNYEIISLPADSGEITELTSALHQDLELIYGKGKLEEFIEGNKEMLVFFAVKDESFKSLACGALNILMIKLPKSKECML